MTEYEQLSDTERQRLYDYIDEGNNKHDLVVMYLESLSPTELESLRTEIRKAEQEVGQ